MRYEALNSLIRLYHGRVRREMSLRNDAAVRMATRLFFETLRYREAYLDTLHSFYGAGVPESDFHHPATEDALAPVETWRSDASTSYAGLEEEDSVTVPQSTNILFIEPQADPAASLGPGGPLFATMHDNSSNFGSRRRRGHPWLPVFAHRMQQAMWLLLGLWVVSDDLKRW